MRGMNMNNKTIQVFYACDDNFVKYTVVSIQSMIENANPDRNYCVHILHTGVSDGMRKITLDLQRDNFRIVFDDVSEYLNLIKTKLPIRDYYSKTTYFRLFIADMFPDYDKAIYIDSDTVVLGDISELFDVDIKDNYVGAANEQAMVQADVYGTYVEECLGIDRNTYFNAGMLLINCKEFRKNKLLERFTELLKTYNFVVTQDEDYLNLLCKDRVFWLDQAWNCEVFGELPVAEEDMKVIHYIMVSKPWHYEDCRLGEYFWRYADRTAVVEELRAELAAYTDAERARDALSCENLAKLAEKETLREDNYYKTLKKSMAKDRLEVLERIENLEREGRFDKDVEDDPPSKVLRAKDVDYTRRKLWSKIKTKVAFKVAGLFVDKLIENKRLIIKDMVGLENFANLDSGAVVTCNHFNAFDSFAIHLAYYASKQKDRQFYRVIREGNYTNFPGLYGFLMKNCNTLPLSSSFTTMKKFMSSTDKILQDGHFVLFYPEQSMWWNYRKPKPLKDGAYKFAVKNNVPVLPCFITMRDSDILGEDGFYVQEYTIHIAPPLYPDKEKSAAENIAYLRDENYRIWKDVYEQTYGIPLSYNTSVIPGENVCGRISVR